MTTLSFPFPTVDGNHSVRHFLNRKTGRLVHAKAKAVAPYRAAVRLKGKVLGCKPILKGDVELWVWFYRGEKPGKVGKRTLVRGDLDGFEKTFYDALQGVLYRNDSQVKHKHVHLLVDRKNPRVEVLIAMAGEGFRPDEAHAPPPDETLAAFNRRIGKLSKALSRVGLEAPSMAWWHMDEKAIQAGPNATLVDPHEGRGAKRSGFHQVVAEAVAKKDEPTRILAPGVASSPVDKAGQNAYSKRIKDMMEKGFTPAIRREVQRAIDDDILLGREVFCDVRATPVVERPTDAENFVDPASFDASDYEKPPKK